MEERSYRSNTNHGGSLQGSLHQRAAYTYPSPIAMDPLPRKYHPSERLGKLWLRRIFRNEYLVLSVLKIYLEI